MLNDFIGLRVIVVVTWEASLRLIPLCSLHTSSVISFLYFNLSYLWIKGILSQRPNKNSGLCHGVDAKYDF